MKYNGVVQYEQEYGAFGQIGLLRDIKNGMEYRYEYDTVGRLLRSTGTPTSSNGFATLDFTNTDDPSLSTAQQRYWKNERFYNGHNYSDSNLELMKKGRAPLVKGENGKWYPMELHHKTPRHKGGGHTLDNLLPVAPWEHAEIDKFRHFKY